MTNRPRFTERVASRTVRRIQRGDKHLALAGYIELLTGILEGSVEALTTLGTLLTYRVGIRDLSEIAYACDLAAARRGDAIGQCHLGMALIEGEGVAKDVRRGLYWLRMARRKGSMEATNCLGHSYRYGIGLRKDPRNGALELMKEFRRRRRTRRGAAIGKR